MKLEGRYYSKNIDVLGYHDLNDRPGFQMALQEVNGKYYLYCASFRHPGITILDVTDRQVCGRSPAERTAGK